MISETELQKKKQKILEGTTGLVARHLNKRISLPISLWLVRHTRIRPNQITCFNILLGLLTLPIAAQGTPLAFASAGILLQIASILDGVDGEVAKLTGRSSIFGQWLDTISDNLTLVCFLAGTAWGLHRSYPEAPVLGLTVTTFAGYILLTAIMLIFLRRDTQSGSLVTYDKEFLSRLTRSEFPIAARLVNSLKYLMKKDFFSLFFCLFTLIGHPLWIFSLSSAAVVIASILIFYVNLVRRVRLNCTEARREI